jgi:AraC-like DNA-binding protein
MLNDYFIARDAPSFLVRYLEAGEIDLPVYRRKLLSLCQQQQISYEQWWALLDELNTLVEKTALGIEIGKGIRIEHCGLLGYLFRTSSNVMQALSCYQRYERLLYAGGGVKTSISKGILSLSWPAEVGQSTLISDALLLAALVATTREILEDASVSPVAVHFRQAISIDSLACYTHFFNAQVICNSPELAISYQLNDLNREIPSQDQTLHQLLGQQAQSLLSQLPEADAFLTTVRTAIVERLHDARSDAGSIAKSLGISTRSFHRELNSRGVQYKNILRGVRKTMALHHLKDATLSLSEITLLLGYSEQSAFNRAHKLWFGSTPQQHRVELLDPVSIS